MQENDYPHIDHFVSELEVINHQRNNWWKSMLGKRYTLSFAPTGALLRLSSRTYASSVINPLIKVVALGDPEPLPYLTPHPNGNLMLRSFYSTDGQFCALQLLRFYNFEYNPATETHIYTGPQAADIIDYLR